MRGLSWACPSDMPQEPEIIHATAVVLEGKGLLIIGPSGSGKSSLALDLIAKGATLICDDRVAVRAQEGRLWARGIDTLAGLIEARGMGLLNVPFEREHAIDVVIDMQPDTVLRLPKEQFTLLRGVYVKKINYTDTTAFAAALVIWARHGFADV